MRLILVGCEYAGKTTLANEIVAWIGRTFGSSRTFHDHFSLPCNEFSEEEQEQLAALSPRLKEMFQRYMMNYHFHDAFYGDPDHNLVGFHIEEAVYAPLYYGYGGKGDYAERSSLARAMEEEILNKAPDTVMVLLRARSEIIAKRMRENPHARQLIQEEDIDYVLQRFEEEYQTSLLRKKFALDTSDVAVEQTLAEFVEQIESRLSQADQLRLLAHHAWPQG